MQLIHMKNYVFFYIKSKGTYNGPLHYKYGAQKSPVTLKILCGSESEFVLSWSAALTFNVWFHSQTHKDSCDLTVVEE